MLNQLNPFYTDFPVRQIYINTLEVKINFVAT